MYKLPPCKLKKNFSVPFIRSVRKMTNEYKVDLDVYNGPLDLLLYLIKKEEVNICDIPIARITDQYLQYVEALQSLDMSIVGDFLVMAATLMYVKSYMLLPRTELKEDDDEVEDPRSSLVKQLLEYKRYKERTFILADRAAEWEKKVLTNTQRAHYRNARRERRATAAGGYQGVGSFAKVFSTHEAAIA